MNNNSQIEYFIDSTPKDQELSRDELLFLAKYDKCYDEGVGDRLVRKTWDSLFDDFVQSNRFSSTLPVKCLVPFLGAGKIVLQSPHNIGFHTFNQDYYCHYIAEKITSGRQVSSWVKYDFGSISEYFMVANSGDFNTFEVVMCQPPKECKLATLDSDNSMATIAMNDARLYYFLRATNFMQKDSILFMFINHNDAEEFMDKIEAYSFRTAVRVKFDSIFIDDDLKNEFIALKYKAI